MTEQFDPATDSTWRWRRRDEVSSYHQYQGFSVEKSGCGKELYPVLGQGCPNPPAWQRCKDCEALRKEREKCGGTSLRQFSDGYTVGPAERAKREGVKMDWTITIVDGEGHEHERSGTANGVPDLKKGVEQAINDIADDISTTVIDELFGDGS